MSNNNTETFRIQGSKLDEDELWVDATVTDITLESTVTLEEDVEANPRTWTVPLDEFNQWRTDNFAANVGDLSDPGHTVWSGLEDLYQMRNDPIIDTVAARLEGSVTSVFKAIIYAQKSN